MSRTPTPRSTETLFVERRTYRRRRTTDAVRILPWLATALSLVPLLWGATSGPEAVRTSMALLYVFGVWVVLVLLSLLMSIRLRPEPADTVDDAADPTVPDATDAPSDPGPTP